ncbi:MAG: sensor histidine kinase, partial [Actinomycetota bacterium]|nr:sensor histidine kinase [Actinomycetota bacterium]
VTLAAQAGVAIENARLFEDAEHRLALEERQRLARDLHDSVSQALFSMTLQTRGAQLALEAAGIDPAGPVGRRLADLKELTEGALAEMRMLIFELRPGAMQEEGLAAAIRKLGQGIAAREALVVEVEAPAERIALRPLAEEQLYRLTQEALTNVVKHARAHRVHVRITPWVQSGELVLEIVDDGVAFDPSLPRPGHLGLRTMADRAESLGGRLEVFSQPGEGTTVRAVIPTASQG